MAGVGGFEAAEFGGDAGLDVEFEVLGAGAVGLRVVLEFAGITGAVGIVWLEKGKYFGAGLEGVDKILGEANGGVAGRRSLLEFESVFGKDRCYLAKTCSVLEGGGFDEP